MAQNNSQQVARTSIYNYGAAIPGIPFEAVALHPMADEEEWLRAAGMKPEECTDVDLYWLYRDSVIFVSLVARPGTPPFVSRWYRPDLPNAVGFHVSTQCAAIDSSIVVTVLSWLSKWIDTATIADGRSESLHVISNSDVAKT